MRRILISGLALLLGGTTLTCVTASKPAPADKANPLVFVFVRVDTEHDLAILRPMIAPDIGVQLDSRPTAGSDKPRDRMVLNCHAANREREALVEGQPGTITEMLLACGEYKFVVKALDFSPHRK
jgi:hypothetical protein